MPRRSLRRPHGQCPGQTRRDVTLSTRPPDAPCLWVDNRPMAAETAHRFRPATIAGYRRVDRHHRFAVGLLGSKRLHAAIPPGNRIVAPRLSKVWRAITETFPDFGGSYIQLAKDRCISRRRERLAASPAVANGVLRFLRVAAILFLLSTVNSPTQGSTSEFERANGLRGRTANTVFRTEVKPNWLPSNTRFWYRVQVRTAA